MSFNAILRFAVMSDIHYQEDSQFQRDRFESAMNTIYNYCANEEYKNLDALYVVGDFADTGTRQQMELFRDDCNKFVKDDTKLVVTLANHELHYVDDYNESMANFKELFNMEFDRHEVISGYHFISLSTTIDKGPWHDSFDASKREYLKAELEKARADGGNKPIFVFQHPGQFGTVSGGVYGNAELYPILSQYPQVIDFSGHSHLAVNNPHEIHQEHFTSVSTGSLYNVHTWARIITPHINTGEARGKENAHMLVVEVDEKFTVRIRKLDVISGEFFENDYYIEDAHDKGKYKYTMSRALYASVPHFEENAKAEITLAEDKVTVTFPRAVCDGDRVFEYNVRLLDKNGVVIAQYSMTSDYACSHQADSYSMTFDNPPEGIHSSLIYAIGFWDNYSEPLKAKKVIL